MSSEVCETFDHTGAPVKHGRTRVNGIRLYYITAGQGPPLLLLHGTPKNSYYWHKLFPLLTPHFTVVAPDLRGFGYTDKPPASEGYDSGTNAKDVTELMTYLGYDKFHLHGEDRGADYAFGVAGLYRDRVLTMSFCEMVPSGLGLEETSFWTKDNVTAQFRQKGVWCWHLGFFWIPHIPEMLIQGHEREFWEMFMKQECYNPAKITPQELDHWVGCVKQPGGLRGVLETYRSGFVNGEINQKISKEKLTLPVMCIGAPEFFGPQVEESIKPYCDNIVHSEVFQECGHSLSLEAEERLADRLKKFMLDKAYNKK